MAGTFSINAAPKVALLIETSNAFSRELLRGVRDWMRTQRAWTIYLSEQGRGNEPPRWLKSWRGDGIIARIENPKIARAVRSCGVPVVNVSATGLAAEFPAVISDSTAIAEAAATHFLERGFRNFGYCGDARFVWSKRHEEHFTAACDEAGVRCSVFPTTGEESDRAKISRWIASLPKPVGIMACYDIGGQQVLDACRAIGLRVPEEVAVIGQHNDELLCEMCDPPLSSVIPNARRVGYEAARLLDEAMQGGKAKAEVLRVVPMGVATRASSDLVAVEDPGLRTAIRFIREHVAEGISVVDIAAAAGMSRSLLERRFRAVIGTSVWDHVLRLRMQQAQHLLTRSSLGMAEIAERTGFGTAEHFSASCRRLTGVPPVEWRRRGKTEG